MSNPHHFLDLDAFSGEELRFLLERAKEIKQDLKRGIAPMPLAGKQVALVFEKPSTRTRMSFEAGVNQLGGHALLLTSGDSQLGRGETIADTARVLSRYVDVIMLRTFKHDTLLEMAKYATVPVINGLTDASHPCQIMTDIMTFEEHRGLITGKRVAWVGDCNNVANSWIHASEKLGFELVIAAPEELQPPSNLPANVTLLTDPQEAVKDADLVTTDTWVSMGDTDAEFKRNLLKDYQVNDALMAQAKPNALFMHCLPAHRGEEVTDSVMDGAQSVVFDEAENRLHSQKAIMLWCLGLLQQANGAGKAAKVA